MLSHRSSGYQVTGTEADKGPRKAATGDDNFIVTLIKGTGGKLAVKDVQGNVAGVVSGPVKVGKVSVYVIDKVLMSGECRCSLASFVDLRVRALHVLHKQMHKSTVQASTPCRAHGFWQAPCSSMPAVPLK
jgi:hypothetical protein